jgi:hypothetical protein
MVPFALLLRFSSLVIRCCGCNVLGTLSRTWSSANIVYRGDVARRQIAYQSADFHGPHGLFDGGAVRAFERHDHQADDALAWAQPSMPLTANYHLLGAFKPEECVSYSKGAD